MEQARDERRPQPNILLVLCDQWAAAAVGTYGAGVPEVTPAIDALAASGTRFDRHYATTPICGPNRATIFTGRSIPVHGVYFNNMELTGDTPLFTQLLRSAGYWTGGVGKFHFTPMHLPPPDDLEHLGFDWVAVTEDPKHGAWLEWVAREHPDHYERALAVSWPMPYLAEYGPERVDLRQRWVEARQRFVKPRPAEMSFLAHESPLPLELHQTRWITDMAIAQIDRRREAGGKPWFLYTSYVDPHDPYDPPKPYSTLYGPGDVPPRVPQEWDRDDCAVEYKAFHDGFLKVGAYGEDTWADLRTHYFGSCRFIDDEIARLLGHLTATGLADDTIVVFTTDHGDMIGDHGLLMKGSFHYDSCIRCPLIISGPGVPQGVVSDQLTSSLDIFPTILDLADVPATVPLEGAAVGPWSTADTAGRDVAVELLTTPTALGPADDSGVAVGAVTMGSKTVVTEDGWRLTLFPGQSYGEMFDLDEDPQEQGNRFRDPTMRDHRLELTDRLVTSLARQAFPFPARGRNPDVDYDTHGFVMKPPTVASVP